ncbi:Ras-related protein Ric [Acrasis kona]|uniref:Ras-related protein Ric n=1 Tax=Acrasis kona TaxID=1008807 RepID=A0AAW2Z7Q4_9EUKA
MSCFGAKKGTSGKNKTPSITIRSETRQPNNDSRNKVFKLLVIGESGVGKTAITTRYVDDQFKSEMMSTIGVDFKKKKVVRDGIDYNLQIWDTAGQEKFRSMTKSHYRGIQGVIVVFDVTSSESFQNITRWMQDISTHAPPKVFKVLCGNKSDLPGRQVSTQEGNKLSSEYQAPYLEVSAKTNTNITELFDAVVDGIIKTV